MLCYPLLLSQFLSVRAERRAERVLHTNLKHYFHAGENGCSAERGAWRSVRRRRDSRFNPQMSTEMIAAVLTDGALKVQRYRTSMASASFAFRLLMAKSAWQ